MSYASPKNRTKRWPTEAQMEGWFPRFRGDPARRRIATRWSGPRSESSDRAARSGSAAARAELRARTLDSRTPSQDGSRRPDRRIRGDGGSTSCAPPLWKEVEAAFSTASDNQISVKRERNEGKRPPPRVVPSGPRRAARVTAPTRSSLGRMEDACPEPLRRPQSRPAPSVQARLMAHGLGLSCAAPPAGAGRRGSVRT